MSEVVRVPRLNAESKALVEQKMRDRKDAYCRVFQNDVVENSAIFVLRDLATFCREGSTTFDLNERVHCALEGRREVMLRIRDYLNLSVQELCNKYVKGYTDGE